MKRKIILFEGMKDPELGSPFPFSIDSFTIWHQMKTRIFLFSILLMATMTSCFQAHSEDDELRTVPVTNNPHVVPNYGGGFPMGAG